MLAVPVIGLEMDIVTLIKDLAANPKRATSMEATVKFLVILSIFGIFINVGQMFFKM